MQFLRNLFGKLAGSSVPSPPVAAPVCSRLKVGWATDVGQMRSHNEDTALVITTAHDGDDALPALGLFALADGMGGHQSGEVASSLAVRTVAHHVLNRFYLSLLTSEVRDTAQPVLNELLVDAVRAANDAVATQVPGGGTTLTCALTMGARVYFAHVGDSRAYVIADGEMSQITHDHSLVDRLVELGQLTRDEAAIHPQKNVLYRAVGQRGVLEVDTYVRSIPQGGHLLLCSDGLWGLVSDVEIVKAILNASSPQEACEELVDAANQAGGRDNITIVLAELPLG